MTLNQLYSKCWPRVVMSTYLFQWLQKKRAAIWKAGQCIGTKTCDHHHQSFSYFSWLESLMWFIVGAWLPARWASDSLDTASDVSSGFIHVYMWFCNILWSLIVYCRKINHLLLLLLLLLPPPLPLPLLSPAASGSRSFKWKLYYHKTKELRQWHIFVFV